MRTSIATELLRLLLAVAAVIWLASLLGYQAVEWLSGLPL